MTFQAWLAGLNGGLTIEETVVTLDSESAKVYKLTCPAHDEGVVLLVGLALLIETDMRPHTLTTFLKSFVAYPLLVVINGAPLNEGETLYNWREDHAVIARLHALFFGRVYFWNEDLVTAVHFVDHNGNRTAQPAPADRYPFTRLKVSAPHDCFHADLSGYEWRTMSFGEQNWWERQESTQTSGTGYTGSFHRHEAPPRQDPPPRRRQTPMSDAEFMDYLRRVREEAQRMYEQTHYTPPRRTAVGNRYQQALATLGLDGRATPEQIKAAYRAKARQLHPDTNNAPDATRQMQELNLAYEYLKESL